MTNFVIIEDQQMVCEMFAEFICRKMPDLHLAGHAASANEGLALCRQLRPQLVLIDIRIPDVDGIETARRIHAELPETRIIIVSGECSPYNCYRISTGNIHGFVDKTRPLSELYEAITAVMNGKT
jgi:DNA-binding NarL/FixJ family response regulator